MNIKYKPAAIEVFHGEALKEFHQKAEFEVNEARVDGIKYINGIEFNRLLARFKVKVMEAYGITDKPSVINDEISLKDFEILTPNGWVDLKDFDVNTMEVAQFPTY